MSDSALPKAARRGLLLVLSSPSGAGKTTLAKRLVAADPMIVPSISVTTRAQRPGEVEGRDYYFIDTPRFKAMQDSGELLEGAEVFRNFYGTPRKPVMEAISSGRDVLFDIDWQGARQLADTVTQDLVRVFILPPTAQALAQRLRTRAQDGPDVVARRMAGAAGEISHWVEYDYVLINAEVDHCYAQLKAILDAERLRRARQIGLHAHVATLLGELSGA